MTIRTRSELEDAINVVRNETQTGANTKERIASLLQDISDSAALKLLVNGAEVGAIDNATLTTAGLMSTSQVAALNAAVLAAAHGHTTAAKPLGYDVATSVVPSIAITGMAASSRYNLVVGARVTVHQTGTPANYGFVDVVAYGYVISGTGGAGSELRIARSTADSSKLSSALAATTAAIADKTSSDFKITVTRPAGVSILVDAVEYWIATLEKLTL